MYENLKKKYGQNFLIDNNILNKITDLISSSNLKILEIGPGDGRLTDNILKKNPENLKLVEIDEDLFKNLKNKYLKNKNVDIENENILNYKIKKSYDLIISNLPYNISSQVLVQLSSLNLRPKKMILMFQKEFASRLLDINLNSINALINCFYDVKLRFNVSKNCFRPIPKVNSSILTFERKEEFLLKEIEIDNYIRFKRKLFSHKRKSLKNLLKDYNIKGDFDLNLRAEKLKLTSLIDIFREINV
ncbi:MAG: 16S rRNA (adenine(1518)-N(6)/adenine(1519)-N(6))-dimethyltransferase RsmA [Alphaproteobacteria bacterium]|nr:16S rRNA (adenine(1518)-N(6)/adenine(1519)-N(6))-dimethyltransferase RsmA [Alphaproteobacteria bacterium]